MPTAAPEEPAAPLRGIEALVARHPLVFFSVRPTPSRGSCGPRGPCSRSFLEEDFSRKFRCWIFSETRRAQKARQISARVDEVVQR